MNIDKDIEYLKGYKYDNEVKQAIENVLKEVERLQRENNTLTTQNAMMSERHFKDGGKLKELEKYKRKHSLVKNHYVSKDKIRELIEELEGHIWKDGYMTKFDKYAIHYLKELLGE